MIISKYVTCLAIHMIIEKMFYHYDNLREKTDKDGRIRIYTIENLANKRLCFGDSDKFNDPFDCKVYLDDKGTREQWIELLCRNRYTYTKAIEIVNRFNQVGDLVTPSEGLKSIIGKRICCFSVKNNGTLLWSHYADRHQGICLCFRASKESIGNNEYSMPLYIPNSGQNTAYSGQFKEIYYTDDGIPVISLFDNPHRNANIVENQMYKKSSEWNYEDEWRIVNYAPTEDGLMEYYDGCLEGVIFGLKTHPGKAKLVYEAIKKNYTNNVNFYRATEITGTTTIEIVKIPDIEVYIKGISM